MNSFEYIKSTFLKLTSRTYPYGTENELFSLDGVFPSDLKKDNYGNYYCKVGDSRTIFTSHLDTASQGIVDITHVISDEQIVTTDGTTILGADDKAGVTILLWMIRNKIPGLYYFFIGEEVGCIGSGALATNPAELRVKYDRVISFDRRGKTSVITHQSCNRTCSDDFATALSKQLNLRTDFYYTPDDTGIYTDSAEFVDIISECTNISVGYLNEHTTKESQDLYHLNKLALACLHIEWEKLPTKRDCSKKETKYDWVDSKYVWNSKKGDYDYIVKKPKNKRGKRNRNKNKNVDQRGGRSFYDDGGLLRLMDKHKNKGMFDVYRDKFLTTDFTKSELETVREQYLDINNVYDVRAYQELIELSRSL